MSFSEYRNLQSLVKRQSDDEKRQYGCPCGKFYLSYPALFTHVKQKHQGKPPGKLIKPPKDINVKRGRPPIHPHEKTQSQEHEGPNLHDYFDDLIPNDTLIDFNQQWEWHSGTSSCNQIFSKFLKTFAKDQFKKKILNCLVCLMKDYLTKNRGEKFCEEENAAEIIDISNQIVMDFDKYAERYPIPRKMLIQLLFGFFTWLYQQKLTNHKLEKVAQINLEI